MSTLNRSILDNLWQAGFCRTLIERLRRTRPGQADSSTRVAITQEHILHDSCQSCFFANTLKSIEAETAKWLGPQAEAVWLRGGDVRSFPDFDEGFRIIMSAAISQGLVHPEITEWISKTVKERAGRPYPDTEDNDAQKAN